ncbi:MAG: amino acid permease [Pseudomonadota bacterium]
MATDNYQGIERGGSGGTPSLGVWSLTALVVGNVIGAGFFLAPAALAPYGAVAVIGWLIFTLGAMCLGIIFARLGRLSPETGGPYAYTRKAFGDFAGFLVAWGAWISIWASLPAIGLAAADYLEVFLPFLQGRPILKVGLALAAIWSVALLNMQGVKEAGLFQLIVVAMKLVPLLGVSLVGLFYVDWSQFTPVNPSGVPFLLALAATAPLIMFAFTGVESATVPAGDVINPRWAIPVATIAGLSIAALVYVSGTISTMGSLGLETLEKSSAPFADTATKNWGAWAGYTMAAAAILSSLAALNGWILVMTQLPMAAARDGLLPPVFAKLNGRGVAAQGMIVSVTLASLILIFESSGASVLIVIYDFIVNLTTTTYMVPYLFCCFVEAMLLVTHRQGARRIPPGYFTIAAIGFIFAMVTVYGAGAEAAFWALLLLLAGIPVFAWLKSRR